MIFSTPDSLLHLNHRDDGRLWLTRLPSILQRAVSLWDLEDIGTPFRGSSVSYTVPARRANVGTVLKIQFPHPECEHEAAALQLWNGEGAAKLLEHDPSINALLLERCDPGHHLADDIAADPLDVLRDLLPQLWKPVDDTFTSLKIEAANWASNLKTDWMNTGKPCEEALVDAALAYLTELPKDMTETVLLHQDLHGQNIISAQRQPWLAIDPKPLSGERAFSLAPIVRSFEFGHSKDAALRRLDKLSTDLSLDRQRALGWTVAQTMAWSFDSSFSERHFETTRWLLDSHVKKQSGPTKLL